MRLIFILTILCVTSYVDAIRIECSYSNNGYFSYESFQATIRYCVVKSSFITEPNQRISSFTVTGSFMEIQGIFFGSKTVNYVPSNIAVYNPQIRGLIIQSCHLKAIEKVDIQGLPRLKELFLNDNDLESLKNGLFDSNPALEKIRFDSNKIKSVGFDILKPLTNLKEANFNSNPCISKDSTTTAEIAAFRSELNQKCISFEEMQQQFRDEMDTRTVEMTRLRNKLSDTESHLRAIDGNLNAATKKLYVLKKIEVENEKLREALSLANVTINEFTVSISSLSEEEMTLMCRNSDDKTVCDGFMAVVIIPGYKFRADNKYELKNLSIVNQQTLFLPNDLAEEFPNLTEMSVVRSGLFEIDAKVLKGLHGLKTLNFNDNKLREIKANTFRDQTNMTKLDLSFNKIEDINEGAFDGLAKLETLLLNNNLLIRIDERDFKILTKLQVLTLNKNILRFISPNLLSALKDLKSADLTDNVCTDSYFPEGSLKSIEMSLTERCVAKRFRINQIEFNQKNETMENEK